MTYLEKLLAQKVAELKAAHPLAYIKIKHEIEQIKACIIEADRVNEKN